MSRLISSTSPTCGLAKLPTSMTGTASNPVIFWSFSISPLFRSLPSLWSPIGNTDVLINQLMAVSAWADKSVPMLQYFELGLIAWQSDKLRVKWIRSTRQLNTNPCSLVQQLMPIGWIGNLTVWSELECRHRSRTPVGAHSLAWQRGEYTRIQVDRDAAAIKLTY